MDFTEHKLHDEHHGDAQTTHDTLMHENEARDYGFVDMVEFGFLVTRTAALEKRSVNVLSSFNLFAYRGNIRHRRIDSVKASFARRHSGTSAATCGHS